MKKRCAFIVAIILLLVTATSVLAVTISYGDNDDNVFQAYTSLTNKTRGKTKMRVTEEVIGEETSDTLIDSVGASVSASDEYESYTKAELLALVFGDYHFSTSSAVYSAGVRDGIWGPSQMKTVEVKIHKYNGGGVPIDTTAELRVHQNVADTIIEIFDRIYNEVPEFQIQTSSNNWIESHYPRNVTNGASMSYHSYGIAIDINPGQNPYGGSFESWQSNYGNDPRCVTVDVVNIFASYGWGWGGDYRRTKDYMHFSVGETDVHVRNEMRVWP